MPVLCSDIEWSLAVSVSEIYKVVIACSTVHVLLGVLFYFFFHLFKTIIPTLGYVLKEHFCSSLLLNHVQNDLRAASFVG